MPILRTTFRSCFYYLRLDLPRPPLIKVNSKHCRVHNNDLNCFVEDLSRLQVVNNPPTDLPALVDAYQSQINILLDKHAPIKLRSMTLRPHTPWFSDELRALKHEKCRWERRWVKSGLEVHKQLYRDSANNYYAAIKEAKRAHFNNKISISNQKQLFHLINSLFKVKGLPTLPTHITELELANRFSTSFTDKIRALRSELNKMSPKSLLIPYQEHPSSCTLSKVRGSFASRCKEIHHGSAFQILFTRSTSNEFT